MVNSIYMMPRLDNVISEAKARNLSPLTLAFVGDALHSLYVKTALALSHDFKAGALHAYTSREINANAQASRAESIVKILNGDELAIYKRARNVSPRNVPKNADIAAYSKATAFEAVLGYLYLTGQTQRLEELLNVN